MELLRDCQGRWRAIARSYAGSDEEDLFQEILLQIWRSLATFRGESAGTTWCYRVALNTALNWKRSARTRRDRLPTHDGYSSEMLSSSAPANESVGAVRQLLADQTPADRAILLLLLDDVGYSEMAEILGTSEGTLRVRIHRLKQRIRQRYQGQFDDL
ncbi:MAG TPA: RNA polymerase sigma factor [Pirellulales bacterium]|nr:RNA polymerase sigma factor [Pirellulales bacterium]